MSHSKSTILHGVYSKSYAMMTGRMTLFPNFSLSFFHFLSVSRSSTSNPFKFQTFIPTLLLSSLVFRSVGGSQPPSVHRSRSRFLDGMEDGSLLRGKGGGHVSLQYLVIHLSPGSQLRANRISSEIGRLRISSHVHFGSDFHFS
jgi:hypothetical protein